STGRAGLTDGIGYARVEKFEVSHPGAPPRENPATGILSMGAPAADYAPCMGFQCRLCLLSCWPGRRVLARGTLSGVAFRVARGRYTHRQSFLQAPTQL